MAYGIKHEQKATIKCGLCDNPMLPLTITKFIFSCVNQGRGLGTTYTVPAAGSRKRSAVMSASVKMKGISVVHGHCHSVSFSALDNHRLSVPPVVQASDQDSAGSFRLNFL